MASSARQSTLANYESRWRTYCDWCSGRGEDPISPSAARLADFFIYLREQKFFSLSAVKGYRSALSHIFALQGLDLTQSREISMLFRHFEVSCPFKVIQPPKWDLTLVLRSLLRRPYEPLSSASDKDLTLKTIFLLAFASSKRVSELHGLSCAVRRRLDGKSLAFSFAPDFIAKTQRPEHPSSYFDEFSVPSLQDFVGADPDEMLLCPVRSLNAYLDRTAPLRPSSSKRLFLSSGRIKKEVSKNTISFWLRRVIRRAYEDLPDNEVTLARISIQEIRAVSTSSLFRKNLSVAQVMRAAQWRSISTFASFYLWDVTHRYLDTYSLGPVVAAQSVV